MSNFVNWKQAIGEAAQTFFFPQRSLEKLASSVTGVPFIRGYNISHAPFIGDMVSAQRAVTMLRFDNPGSADQICALLNSALFDAARQKKSNHFFFGCVRHDGHPMMDRIVFVREDNGFFQLGSLYNHLKEVQKNINTTGRTFADQVRQQQMLSQVRPTNFSFSNTSYGGKQVPQVS